MEVYREAWQSEAAAPSPRVARAHMAASRRASGPGAKAGRAGWPAVRVHSRLPRICCSHMPQPSTAAAERYRPTHCRRALWPPMLLALAASSPRTICDLPDSPGMLRAIAPRAQQVQPASEVRMAPSKAIQITAALNKWLLL